MFKNMPKINRWVTLFFVTMVMYMIITFFFALGSNMVADVLRTIIVLVNGISGLYILYKVSQRDPIIYENETIKMLIYYKEHSKKQKDFPLTPSLMLVYAITVIANVGYLGIAFYYAYFMN